MKELSFSSYKKENNRISWSGMSNFFHKSVIATLLLFVQDGKISTILIYFFLNSW